MEFILNSDTNSSAGIDDEEELLGTTHAEVGRVFADHWKLQKTLKEAIACHHKPMLKPDSEHVLMIHISDIISHHALESVDKNLSPDFNPEILKKSDSLQKRCINSLMI
ncbi:MAG: HDOD domain-containing protein [Candidatus Latescibacteria bacterium]|jgi:HD-like signal output (HDOD) protein|nr:HDOD domain-containing protein [Candidatus Latescibacterota bacterium]